MRAFALAATCSLSTDADSDCDFADIDFAADPVTGLFPADSNNDGICTAADADTFTGLRKDNNDDGVCNIADADHTPGDRNWEDDTIPLDADGVARPRIGLGFSTDRPLDIRTGGGEDEVQYNVNAPVSVDGGTGFDKLVILGTEFADDIVVTSKGIFGAGLNVRYANVEIVEVDGLEGDDEFFVQSTAFGVAYRVIGGLGSDTINVTGDVVEDIVTRELEGVSGTVDHRVRSILDRLYDGLPVDGLDYNLATPDAGLVVIDDEGPEGTSVREGGSVSVPEIDSWTVSLATTPTANVYVTVSAARSPQEEADDTFANPEPAGSVDSLPDGEADTVWLCAGPAGSCAAISDFKRFKWVNGFLVDEANRALVLTFTPGNWDQKQYVHVLAVDDPRAEGDRVMTVAHSVISQDTRFDDVAVRNVEVSIRDNDTPGVYVTKVAPGTISEDGRTLVIEGAGIPYTGLRDELLIALPKQPDAGDVIRLKVVLDAASQQAISLVEPGARRALPALGGRLVDVLHDRLRRDELGRPGARRSSRRATTARPRTRRRRRSPSRATPTRPTPTAARRSTPASTTSSRTCARAAASRTSRSSTTRPPAWSRSRAARARSSCAAATRSARCRARPTTTRSA